MDVLTSNIDLIKTYNSYHTHPINKAIHFFCIPLIVFSTNELLKRNFILQMNLFVIQDYKSISNFILLGFVINYIVFIIFINLVCIQVY